MRAFRTLFKNGLLTTAVFILLLHALVPHQHLTGPLAEPIIKACAHSENTLLDFLGEVFHLDVGTEHLENYKPVNKVDLQHECAPLAAVLLFETSVLAVESDQHHQVPVSYLPLPQAFDEVISLRGPPRV